MSDRAEMVFAVLTMVVAVIFAITLVYAQVAIRTQSECLRKGWPKGDVTLQFEAVCKRTVMMTEYVVPLAALQEAGGDQ